MSRTTDIIELILERSKQLNPTYTKEQHLSYTVGFLASIVMEKNHMDSIVWTRIRERLNIH